MRRFTYSRGTQYVIFLEVNINGEIEVVDDILPDNIDAGEAMDLYAEAEEALELQLETERSIGYENFKYE
jgi:hypothetical protein